MAVCVAIITDKTSARHILNDERKPKFVLNKIVNGFRRQLLCDKLMFAGGVNMGHVEI